MPHKWAHLHFPPHQALVCQGQAPQGIFLVHVNPRIVQDQLRLETRQHAWKCVCKNPAYKLHTATDMPGAECCFVN